MTEPITQIGSPQWQRAPANASPIPVRKRLSKSAGFSSGLIFMCSFTYSLTPIGMNPIFPSCLQCQFPHHSQIAHVVARPVDRRLTDERNVFQLWVAHDAAKSGGADLPFANVLVAVSVRAKGGLGIVGVNHPHLLYADRRVKMIHGGTQAFDGVDGVPRFKTVRGINARADRQVLLRARDDLRHFFV